MGTTLYYPYILIIYPIYQSVGAINAPAPISGQICPRRFRLADTSIAIPVYVLYQLQNTLQENYTFIIVGTISVNLVPAPSWLSTLIFISCWSAIHLAIDSPRPVPPGWPASLVRELSTR